MDTCRRVDMAVWCDQNTVDSKASLTVSYFESCGQHATVGDLIAMAEKMVKDA